MNNIIGELSAARWITLGSRILRMLISSTPSEESMIKLRKLARYIILVYYQVINTLSTQLNLFIDYVSYFVNKISASPFDLFDVNAIP